MRRIQPRRPGGGQVHAGAGGFIRSARTRFRRNLPHEKRSLMAKSLGNEPLPPCTRILRSSQSEPLWLCRHRAFTNCSRPGFAPRMGIAILSEVVLSALFLGTRPPSPATPVPAHRIAPSKFSLRPDSSVVERGPEKAGVGGSIPSLATTLNHPIESNSRALGLSARSAPNPAGGLEKPSRRRFNPVSGHHS